MKHTITILFLVATIKANSQWYYGSSVGAYTGHKKVENLILNKQEVLNYSGLFYNSPIGIKNDYNVLFESSIGYAGDITTSLNVGYQLGEDKPANIQLLVGGADFITPLRHFKLKHSISYNGIGRLNIGHFFFQVHYSEQTYFIGIGFKGYTYE